MVIKVMENFLTAEGDPVELSLYSVGLLTIMKDVLEKKERREAKKDIDEFIKATFEQMMKSETTEIKEDED